MTPVAPDSVVPPGEGEGTATPAWRDVLARRLGAAASAVALVGALAVLALVEGPGREELALGGFVSSLGFAASLHPRMPSRPRGWLLVGSATLSAVAGYAALGFVGGPAASLLVAVILAALLLGRRAAVVAVLGSGVAIALVAWGVVTERLPTPSAADASPLDPIAWARSVGITLLLAGLAGALVTWVVAQLEDARLRALREGELRRDAEGRRRVAEQLAMEAQKRELVGRLGAGLAHDFNNHLTVIAMAHGRLADPSADASAKRDASRAIMDSVRTAGGLARQLLVFGRRAPVQRVGLALREVVDALLPAIQRILPSDVTLEVVHEGDVTVHADAGQLQQALLNFVVNARDAMPGGGTLTVRTRLVALARHRPMRRGAAAPGAWAVLEVEDSGTGIDEAVRPRVFEPFFTTKELDQGSGLGLATVAMMAEEAGGHVELDTEVGRGTRLAVWLPASDAVVPGGVRASTPPPPAPALGGCTVLVVEDEPLLLEAAVRVLSEAGCRVVAARDGSEALRRVDEQDASFDLLCTDVVMPGAPVREVIARFVERFPGRPVLTCSGYVGEDLVRRGIEEGRYRLLQKPYAAADLLGAVAGLLPRVSSRGADG